MLAHKLTKYARPLAPLSRNLRNSRYSFQIGAQSATGDGTRCPAANSLPLLEALCPVSCLIGFDR
jgi:hypothetical protein